jgi:hypothetical protein
MMYNGLTMDTGSTSFEPPSLPPPPSAVDHPGGYLYESWIWNNNKRIAMHEYH